MTTAIISKMNELKLFGMSNAYQTSCEINQHYTADELVNYLVEAEWLERQNRLQKGRIRQAKFRYEATVNEIDFAANRNLDKNTIMRLADCSFVQKAENIIITGKTGAGKSYLASALGHQACVKGIKVLYANTTRLMSELKMSKADNSYHREIARIARQKLLILDDFGMQPFDGESRLMLLEILEDRHGKNSTIVTAQLPVSCWQEIIGEPTVADAILDRLVHNAHRIEIDGKDSMRKNKTLITKKER